MSHLSIPHVVIATKYTTNYMAGPPGEGRIVSQPVLMPYHRCLTDISKMANFTGNGTKSMHTSLKDSLKKLDTDYIDLLYVHWWDFSVSVSCKPKSLIVLLKFLVGWHFLCRMSQVKIEGL